MSGDGMQFERTEDKVKVTEGGNHISDFQDLKIAFLDLLDKHNKLAKSHSSLLRDTRSLRQRERTYGI